MISVLLVSAWTFLPQAVPEAQELWKSDVAELLRFEVAGDCIVAEVKKELVGLDRAKGTERWRIPLPEGESWKFFSPKRIILTKFSTGDDTWRLIDVANGREAGATKVSNWGQLKCAQGFFATREGETWIDRLSPDTLKREASFGVKDDLCKVHVETEISSVNLWASSKGLYASVGTFYGSDRAFLYKLDPKLRVIWKLQSPREDSNIRRVAEVGPRLLVDERIEDQHQLRVLNAADGKEISKWAYHKEPKQGSIVIRFSWTDNETPWLLTRKKDEYFIHRWEENRKGRLALFDLRKGAPRPTVSVPDGFDVQRLIGVKDFTGYFLIRDYAESKRDKTRTSILAVEMHEGKVLWTVDCATDYFLEPIYDAASNRILWFRRTYVESKDPKPEPEPGKGTGDSQVPQSHHESSHVVSIDGATGKTSEWNVSTRGEWVVGAPVMVLIPTPVEGIVPEVYDLVAHDVVTQKPLWKVRSVSGSAYTSMHRDADRIIIRDGTLVRALKVPAGGAKK